MLGFLVVLLLCVQHEALKLNMGPINAIQNLIAGPTKSTFDYIIVGGGTAGCVLANRLSESKGKKVLVIEAGTSNYKHKYIRIPAGVRNLFKSSFDWDYNTTKEASSGNREVYLCRGKVLGGSSCTNVLLYNRGDANDYKEWEKSADSSQWSPENVLPYFKKSEDNIHGESKYHGAHGEFSVSDVKYQNPLSKAFLHACEEFGFPANKDFNDWGRSQEGYGRFQVHQRDGERCSAASGFLEPVIKRKNLWIRSETIVRRILFDENQTAIGVEIEKLQQGQSTGKIETIMLTNDANSEIILTGGSINSPQILMLSGVGDEEESKKLGIPVVRHVPAVGQNLQDHPAALVSYTCSPGNEGVALSSQVRIKGTLIPSPTALLQWTLFRSGPLTSTSCDHGAFFKLSTINTALNSASSGGRTDTAVSAEGSGSTDLQMRLITAKAISNDGMSTLVELQKLKELKDGFTFQSIVARPHSRGRVSLRTANPHDKPAIASGYLTDSENHDISILKTGIKLSRKLATMKAFSTYVGEEVFPGVAVQSDEQIEEYIRNSAHTTNALVGTCRMGRADDVTAVVGADLRVHGLNRVRVADASVMPRIPGGQTAAPVVMIAEKAATFILSQF